MATNAENSQLKKATEGGVSGSMAPSTGASQAPEASQSRVANYSTGSTLGPSSQGSGRFTNVKNYINANQGAGDQLGSKITGNVEKGLGKTEKEQATQASNIASNIQAEKDRLAQGTQFNQQLQDQSNNGAQAINNDAAQKQAFQNLYNNQNNANALATQAQSQADAATSAYNQLGQQINNLGTEQGRFALLQQAVKNPQYTQGQQRLDQLFLQTGNPNQLAQAQRDLGKQAQTSAQGLTNTYNTLGTDITGVGTQAADVAKMLQGTLGSETQNLINAQTQEAQGLNTSNAAANAALQTYFTNGYDTLTDDQKALINPLLQSSGLNSGMRTYNILNEGKYNNYLNQGSTNLTGADVLDQNEFNRYAALSGLAGVEPSLFTQAGTGGTQAGIKGQNLISDAQAARTALEQQLNRAATVGTNSGTANANLLNLLNYLEGNKSYNVNTSAGMGSLTPITFTGAANGYGKENVSLLQNQKSPYGQNTDIGRIYGNDGDYNQAVKQLIEKYMSELNTAGYNNTLGGVDPTKVTGNI